MFLLDSLHLKAGLFEENKMAPVTFTNFQQCREYCMKFVCLREGARIHTSTGEESNHTPGHALHKKTMFHHSGTSLRELLTTGLDFWDANLDRVRRDR